MLLEVKSIRVRYGRMVALSDVSLAVPNGGFVALLGANGAGKTTTLRTISGLLRATQGSIHFDGRDISQTRAHVIARQGIAHVPEGRGLLPGISVAENLKIGALANPDKARVPALYDQVFGYFPILRERMGQAAGVLSGGEQQMLSIARALLQAPKLLMVDEMSLGLAPKIVDELMTVLVDLTRKGVSVLCVEQNTRAVLTHATMGYVMETGRTVGIAGRRSHRPRLSRREAARRCRAGRAIDRAPVGPGPGPRFRPFGRGGARLLFRGVPTWPRRTTTDGTCISACSPSRPATMPMDGASPAHWRGPMISPLSWPSRGSPSGRSSTSSSSPMRRLPRWMAHRASC
jgi:branched-chain amino acid transport system ATP-binding protein